MTRTPIIIDTQFICDAQPFCLCVGEPNWADECVCTPVPAHRSSTTICFSCREPMFEIDIDTGKRVGT